MRTVSTFVMESDRCMLCLATTCEDPSQANNAVRFVTGSRRAAPFPVSTSVTYICNPGYHGGGLPIVVCQSKGEWTSLSIMCTSMKLLFGINHLNTTMLN